MRPPECCICEKMLEGESDGGLLSFVKSPSDLDWDKKAEEPGFIGHPPYLEWFCQEHYEMAKQYQNMILREALKKIKSKR